jgi:hypothetical protein
MSIDVKSVFPDIKTALNHISVPRGWAYLKVIDHPKSLERITQDGHIIYVLGNGLLRSPGHPAGNQLIASQLKFLSLTQKQRLFPIFNIEQCGDVVYMGNYKMLEYKKKLSFEGFSYFEYKMARERGDSGTGRRNTIYSSTALTILG